MEKFTVYKHEFPNGKVYIGITKRNPIERWKNGNGYRGQPKMMNAILKYGWENIRHEIIKTGLTENEACEVERNLIKEYDSIDNGYNSSVGGEYANAGAYKYKTGEIYDGFEIAGRSGRKIILKCLECGRTLERYAGSVQKGCVKCECKTKRKKIVKKQRHITFKGKTQSARKWSEELDVPEGTIWARYKKGYPIDESRQDPSWKKIKPCEKCGRSFFPKYKEQKYCSNKCCTDALRKERPMLICQCCGKEFQVNRCVDKHYRGMFCSIDCRINYQKRSL